MRKIQSRLTRSSREWFFEVVVPEYQIGAPKRSKEGDFWTVNSRVTNVGTGTMPVEIAATRGERFPKAAPEKGKEYRDARQTLVLKAGESAEVSIRAEFEPEQIVVDPDAKVLMLRRKSAVAKF